MPNVSAGDSFGEWVVIDTRLPDEPSWRVRCQCSCGTMRVKSVYALLAGRSRSCGCRRAQHVAQGIARHGHARVGKVTSLYRVWAGMVRRCTDQQDEHFVHYGERGIMVHISWRTFERFRDDIIREIGPKPRGCSLDRIDNDGNYEPGNVRWATQSQQMRNTRMNRTATLGGETLCAQEWSEKTGVPAGTIRRRLRDGWSDEDAVTIRPGGMRPVGNTPKSSLCCRAMEVGRE